MHAILIAAGFQGEHVLRRTIAHTIVACGWRQYCWNFNIWGRKRGGAPDYYVKATDEDDGTGGKVHDPKAEWKAYGSFEEAAPDYPVLKFARYKRSRAILFDANASDADYWRQLGPPAAGGDGYYTDTVKMTPQKFGSLCDRVASEVAKKKTEAPGESLIGPVFGLVTLAAGLAVLTWGLVTGGK